MSKTPATAGVLLANVESRVNPLTQSLMAHENNNTPFFPTFDEWARMNTQWSEKTINDICSESSVNDRNVRAFIRFALDEEDGASVAEFIPSVKNANNLYQIKKRIMNLLMASADRFEGIFDELMAV